jgi:acetyl esterase/lipase
MFDMSDCPAILRLLSRTSAAGVFLAILFFVQSPVLWANAQGPGVVVLKNVPYVEGGGEDQKMDLYLPAEALFPVVLYIHGGSLVWGDRKDWPLDTIGRNFARAGVGFAAMSYRLGTAHDWPAMVEDAASALAWLKDNIEPYGGDTSKIFVFGHSSGALISAVLCTDEKYLQSVGCSLDDVTGCIPMGTVLNPSRNFEGIPEERLVEVWKGYRARRSYPGLFPTPDAFRDADPSRHVAPGAPPMLVLIAEGEKYEPPILEQARSFARDMKEVGVPVDIAVLPGRVHMTALYKMADPKDPALLKILDFVRDLSSPAAGSDPETASADNTRSSRS